MEPTFYKSGQGATPLEHAPASSDGALSRVAADMLPWPVAVRRSGAEAQHDKACQFRRVGQTVRLELIVDETGLLGLGREWDQLFEAHGQAHQCFQSFAWNRHWCTHYLDRRPGDARRLAIVTARLDGQLILVCPLAECRHGGLVHLHWMGAPVSQYGDALLSDHPAAPDLLRDGLEFAARITGADLLDLRKVRADSAAAPVLETLGARTLNKEPAPYMDLASAEDFESYAERFSARSRKQRRRRRRRLDELGGLKLVCLEPGDEASAQAALTVKHKRDSLRRTNVIAPALEDTRFEFFFRDVANETAQSTDCLVSLLCCGDDVIAREIGLQCKDGYLAHVAVYDEAYARFGPGVLQIEDMMAQCYARGLGTYDLLAPADSYKLSLADGTVEVCDYVRPLTRRGAIYAHSVLGFVRPLVRRMKHKAPMSLRRALSGVLPRPRKMST